MYSISKYVRGFHAIPAQIRTTTEFGIGRGNHECKKCRQCFQRIPAETGSWIQLKIVLTTHELTSGTSRHEHAYMHIMDTPQVSESDALFRWCLFGKEKYLSRALNVCRLPSLGTFASPQSLAQFSCVTICLFKHSDRSDAVIVLARGHRGVM